MFERSHKDAHASLQRRYAPGLSEVGCGIAVPPPCVPRTSPNRCLSKRKADICWKPMICHCRAQSLAGRKKPSSTLLPWRPGRRTAAEISLWCERGKHAYKSHKPKHAILCTICTILYDVLRYVTIFYVYHSIIYFTCRPGKYLEIQLHSLPVSWHGSRLDANLIYYILQVDSWKLTTDSKRRGARRIAALVVFEAWNFLTAAAVYLLWPVLTWFDKLLLRLPKPCSPPPLKSLLKTWRSTWPWVTWMRHSQSFGLFHARDRIFLNHKYSALRTNMFISKSIMFYHFWCSNLGPVKMQVCADLASLKPLQPLGPWAIHQAWATVCGRCRSD